MQQTESPRLILLRMFLALDATLLFVLGALLMVFPARVELAFHFQNLPGGVDYLVGLWGCAMATLAIGYVIAARNPARQVVWIQIGIARGVLECVFGAVCVMRGIVAWGQAGVGIVAAAVVTVAYIVLYPGKE